MDFIRSAASAVLGTSEEPAKQNGSGAAVMSEQERASNLREAETKAIALFAEIEPLIKAGKTDYQLNEEIHSLGEKRHNVRTHWHKRVIRSGPNTLSPFMENPPDRTIGEDDVLLIDLGPVFESWEADFGRTYILGSDPAKLKLRDALEPMWHKIKAKYDKNPSMTGGELYELSKACAAEDGWEWGAAIAGHIVGDFPHERIPNDKITHYITEGSDKSMTDVDAKGRKREWILEVHLREKEGKYQGFFEQLLTVP